MKFVNPLFLWALFALALPILIHLFNFRRYKTVMFSNVQFLREVKQERNNVRRLKRWLLLFARLFALMFLVLAFAQPFLKGESDQREGPESISIYIDNSYSMGLKQKGVEMLQWAKDKGRAILNNYQEDDLFMIITNEMSVDEQRWKSKEDALDYIEDIELGSNAVSLGRIATKQDYLFQKSSGSSAYRYMISDFQETAIQDLDIADDSLTKNYLVHLNADDVKNIYVDSIWMTYPVSVIGSDNSILYRIKNSSPLDAVDVRVTLKINDIVQAVRELDMMADETVIDTLYFNILKEGWQLGEVHVADYPITNDDAFYFSFNVEKSRRVLEVFNGPASSVIKSVFEGDEAILLDRTPSRGLDYSTFGGYQLVVLNGLEEVSSGLTNSLKKYISAGGSLLLIPPVGLVEDNYKELFAAFGNMSLAKEKVGNYRMMKPNLSSVLLKDVIDNYPANAELPGISKYYPIVASGLVREEVVLRLNNNESLLSIFPVDDGHLMVQAVPLDKDYSTLQDHWSYAPLIYNMSLLGSRQGDMYLSIGDQEWVGVYGKLPGKDDVVSLVSDEMEFIPEQKIIDNRLLLNASRYENIPSGHFRVMSGDKVLSWISFNLNRLESEMKFSRRKELEEKFPYADKVLDGVGEEFRASLSNINDKKPLWRFCIILSLVFFILEIAIIRIMPD